MQTMTKAEQEKFFKDEVEQMKEKAVNSFDSGDMEKTKQWLDACHSFNKAKLGHLLNVDRVQLDYL